MLARAIILLTAAINLGFGIWTVVAPAEVAELLQLAPTGVRGLSEIRAVYGGLLIGLGLAGLVSWRQPTRVSWLRTLAIGFAGLASARLIHLAANGWDLYTAGTGAFEAVVAAAHARAFR